MSRSQEITAQMLAELLNMGRQSGSFSKRLNHDMKHYKNVNLENDPRIVIIKASPLLQDSYEDEYDAMPLSPDMSFSQEMPSQETPSQEIPSQESPFLQESYETDDAMPLHELIRQQQELIRQQQELIRHQQEQLDIYKSENIMSEFKYFPTPESTSENEPESTSEYEPETISEYEPETISEFKYFPTPESTSEYETISELTTPESQPRKKKHLKTVRFRLPLYTQNNTHKRKTRRATPGPRASRATVDRRTTLGPHIRPQIPTILKL